MGHRSRLDRSAVGSARLSHPVTISTAPRQTIPFGSLALTGHGAVANSKALEVAGVTRTTEDPPGGEIMHDARGEPTGMLLDRAKDLVDKHIPDPSDEEEREALIVGARFLMERGWTEGLDRRQLV